MNDKIKAFLESSLLEEYVLGIIDPTKVEEVEGYIRDYPEVKSAYDDLQDNIEMLAKKMAITPPSGLRADILKGIDETMSTQEAVEKPITGFPRWLTLAASIAAVGFCVWALALNAEKSTLNANVEQLEEDYRSLADECDTKDLLYAQIQKEQQFLSDANTARYVLTSNQKAAGLKTVAYWNDKSKESFVQMVNLPKLPEGKCLQLWADVDGKMLNLNVLPDEAGNALVAIPFKERATSLNITLEPLGGSDHPTVADLVASVSI